MARGSIEWRGDTSCRIRIYTGKDPITQKKIYHKEAISGPTRAKCEKTAYARIAEVVTEINQGTWVSPGKATLEGYLTKRFLPFKKARVRQTTYDQIETMCRVHIIPSLGQLQLRKLSPIIVDSFLEDRLEAEKISSGKGKLSICTVRRIYQTLCMALRQAVKWRLIAYNPAEAATPPQNEAKEPDTWTAEEAKIFLAGTKDNRFYAAYLLLMLSALRRGEAAALEVPQISWPDGGIRITQSLVRTSQGPMLNDPKTKKSKSFVPCSPMTMDALRERLMAKGREMVEFEEQCGPGSYVKSDRLFTHEDGTPIGPEFLYKHFKTLTKALKLRDIRLHDLRKTGATLLYSLTKDLRQVKDHLRHSRIGTTDEFYVASIPEAETEAVKQLDDLLGLTPEKSVGCPKDAQRDVQ